MPTNTSLPPKENALFKRILKCYEQKQYKNGLKFAKQILSNPRFSEHGETLAMKGLTLNCLGRKDDAYEFVRRGLRNDLKSHVCWHVFGLLQRSDRKYDEAIKCYRNALRWDKDNLQILRDLSLLQVQMRDMEGYRDTRYQLLVLRPAQRASWIGYAMAYHWLKNYDMCLRVLEEFRKTQSQPKPYDYEHSELLLYQNMVMREAGMMSEALQHLCHYENLIVDKLSIKETRASIYLGMDRSKEAGAIYQDLVVRNPENWAYYKGCEVANSLESEDDRLRFYKETSEKFPKASAPSHLPLSFVTGERFCVMADDCLRSSLRRGVPPLFVVLRPLYSDPRRLAVIEELVLGYVDSLKDTGRFSRDSVGEKEPVTALLWAYYYLAHHFDHCRQHQRALHYIDLGLEHTPLLIELYVLKAKILKHCGDHDEAVRAMDEAQSLDTADRYVNSKCAKYMLRVNQIAEASDLCSKFTREGVSAMENLNEMQCMWFQTECAAAYRRLSNFGEALKKCHEVDRHFSEVVEDQFDFHTYCLRKMTLRAYVRLLRLEDRLRSHAFYFKAARIAIQIYLHLHDHPVIDDGQDMKANAENLTPGELKKMKRKLLKAQKKAELERERQKQKAESERRDQSKRPSNDSEVDGLREEELFPEKLVAVENPLDAAVKFLRPLQLLASDRIETHTLAYDIYRRKGKLLLMLQSLKRGVSVCPSDPKLHTCLVHFRLYVSGLGNLPSSVQTVIARETAAIFTDKDTRSLNADFLCDNSHSLEHVLAGAIVMYELDHTTQVHALNFATNLDSDMQGVNIENCASVLRSLGEGTFGGCDDALGRYQDRCRELFPRAQVFLDPALPTSTDIGPPIPNGSL